MERKAKIKLSREIVVDECPDLSFLEQEWKEEPESERAKILEHQTERLAAFNRGDWHMVGVRCKADILIPHGHNPDCWIMSSMTSPGLWGVESDSGEEYLNEVYQQERAELRGMLESLKSVEIEEA